jgi:cytochrome c oxidase subunit II
MRRKLVDAIRRGIRRIRGRLPLPEWVAIGIAAVAFAIGPAAVLGYGRWASQDVITIKAAQWDYQPKTIYLSQGVPAHLRLVSEDVVHGFSVDELGVKVDDLLPGHVVDITFTPRQAGTYNFECTRYCGLNHGLMYGQIVVRPAQPPRQ